MSRSPIQRRRARGHTGSDSSSVAWSTASPHSTRRPHTSSGKPRRGQRSDGTPRSPQLLKSPSERRWARQLAATPSHASRSSSRASTPTGNRSRRSRKRPQYLCPGRKGMPAAPDETVAEALAAVDFITRRAAQGPGGGLDVDDSPIFYNTDVFSKASMQTRVANSPVRFSACSSPTPRFGPADPVVDIIYNTDTGHKATVTTAVARSARTVPTFRSKTPRIAPTPQPPGDISAVYNTDTGDRMTISSRCLSASSGLAPVDPNLPRFPKPIPSACDEHVGPGTYTGDTSGKGEPRMEIAEFELQQYLHSRRTDTGKPSGARQRQELESRRGPGAYEGAIGVPECMRPHSPSFKFSDFPRYPKPPSSAVPSYGNTPSLFARDRKAWVKPLYISNAGSRTDFVDKNAVDPIGTLKTDTLHKASLATSVARSPLKYSSLRSKECRLADLRNPMAYYPKDRNNQSHLGPGDYDAHLVKDRLMNRTNVGLRETNSWSSGPPQRMDLRLLSDQFATLKPRTAYRRRSILSPASPIGRDSFWGSKRSEYADTELYAESASYFGQDPSTDDC